VSIIDSSNVTTEPLESAKHSHYLQMCKHEKVDKRYTRLEEILPRNWPHIPLGVMQYDIRLDFGKLSSRITRTHEGVAPLFTRRQFGIWWDCYTECNLGMQRDAVDRWYIRTIFRWRGATDIAIWITKYICHDILFCGYFKIVFIFSRKAIWNWWNSSIFGYNLRNKWKYCWNAIPIVILL